MIQRIRELLLGGERKENIFFFATFILLIPSVFFIFDLKKDKYAYASLNGLKLDRRDLILHFYDHIAFFKSLSSVFGEKGAAQIRNFIVGNLSDEEYIINLELNNAVFTSIYERDLLSLGTIENYFLKKIAKDDSLEKEFGFFGGTLLASLKGNREFLSGMQRQGVLLDTIENYIKKLYNAKFVKNLLNVVFSLKNCEKEKKELDFLEARRYVFLKENFKNELMKLNITDDFLISFYEEGIDRQNYLSNMELYYDAISVEKDNLKKEEIEEVFIGSFQERENDFEFAFKELENKFKKTNRSNQILRLDSLTGEIMSTEGEIALEIFKLNHGYDFSYMCLEAGTKVYFLCLKKSDGGKPLDYELVKEKVKFDFCEAEAVREIEKKIEEVRVFCENGEELKNVKFENFKFNLKDAVKNKEEKKHNALEKVLEKKNLNFLKNNSTFIETGEKEIYLWHILKIEKHLEKEVFLNVFKTNARDIDGIKEKMKKNILSLMPEMDLIFEKIKRNVVVENNASLFQ